jgi:hypothetical protein
MNKPLKLRRNTPEEEVAIQRGIDADSDTYTLTFKEIVSMKQRGRGPQKTPTKPHARYRYNFP